MIPVLPVPLVATVLVARAGEPLSELELKAAAFRLMGELEARRRPRLHPPPRPGLRDRRRPAHAHPAPPGRGDRTACTPRVPAELPLLRYYAGSIAHLLPRRRRLKLGAPLFRIRADMRRRAQGTIQRLQGFFREYTAGARVARRQAPVRPRRGPRLRGAHPRPQPGARAAKGASGASSSARKLAFLGLSYKLTPPRRLLFAASLVAFVLGLLSDRGIHRPRSKSSASTSSSPPSGSRSASAP